MLENNRAMAVFTWIGSHTCVYPACVSSVWVHSSPSWSPTHASQSVCTHSCLASSVHRYLGNPQSLAQGTTTLALGQGMEAGVVVAVLEDGCHRTPFSSFLASQPGDSGSSLVASRYSRPLDWCSLPWDTVREDLYGTSAQKSIILLLWQ